MKTGKGKRCKNKGRLVFGGACRTHKGKPLKILLAFITISATLGGFKADVFDPIIEIFSNEKARLPVDGLNELYDFDRYLHNNHKPVFYDYMRAAKEVSFYQERLNEVSGAKKEGIQNSLNISIQKHFNLTYDYYNSLSSLSRYSNRIMDATIIAEGEEYVNLAKQSIAESRKNGAVNFLDYNIHLTTQIKLEELISNTNVKLNSIR